MDALILERTWMCMFGGFTFLSYKATQQIYQSIAGKALTL